MTGSRTVDHEMIERLELRNFKAFQRFSARFHGSAYVVGPNNAGKSTLIAALRVAALMLRAASRRAPSSRVLHKGEEFVGYEFAPNQFTLVEENLRHEFQEVETSLVVSFSDHATLEAVWPMAAEEAPSGGYFLLRQGDWQPRTVRDIRQLFPRVGVVPMLYPLEQEESVLDEDYLRRNLDGRLASRHFRNQLRLQQRERTPSGDWGFDAYLAFCHRWLPEVSLEDLRTSISSDGMNLDLFYREVGSRTEKELFWAGDGIQVWLQLLLHLFRQEDVECVILDEPDLYLHADLQRRLVRLLDSLPSQTITATHSAEILAEAQPREIMWVDKSRRKAVSAPSEAALEGLSGAIGSQFNLRLAKALKAKVVLFVEGQDMKVLRDVAKTVGATSVANEIGLAVVPLSGYSRWGEVEPFRWLNEKFLKASVREFVLLDRDYRPDSEVKKVKKKLGDLGITVHVWRRKELESYLLEPAAIARLSGADVDWVSNALSNIADSMKHMVSARMLVERQQLVPRDHAVQAAEQATEDFARLWSDPALRLELCPPKAVLTELNKQLDQAGHATVSVRQLAKRLHAAEIPREMASILQRIEDALNS
jgi:AAA domain, putative AbiEii toxin, Type IV TA system